MVLSQDTLRRLMAYAWPGNVRQLENAVERALILRGARAQVEVNDLPPEIQAVPVESAPSLDLPESGVDLPALVSRIERDLIGRALARTDGNRRRRGPAARPETHDAGREAEASARTQQLDRTAMPPRFAYWTILVDGQPTAFRAAEVDELLPTLKRMQVKQPGAEMKWFERGRLWPSRDEARDLLRRGYTVAPTEPGRNPTPPPGARKSWRPGGEHRDPREKYQLAKKAKWQKFKQMVRSRPGHGPKPGDDAPAPFDADDLQPPDSTPESTPIDSPPDTPAADAPPPSTDWRGRPAAPRSPKPAWRDRPSGPRGPKPEWRDKGPSARGPRPEWRDRPAGPRGPKPEWRDKAPSDRGPKPEWRDRPAGPRGPKPEWRDRGPSARGPKPEWRDRARGPPWPQARMA